MPTRISLRRVEEPPRASSWPYPVRWPNFSRMRRRLENAPLLVGLKPRSKCSNQSFGRGASSYLCAVPRPTDQPLTTLSASKHDRPTDQRAVVGDFGWQLSKNLLCEAARSGGSYVWNRQRHLERVPASLPGPSWRLSIASSLLSSLREMHSHIRATTWLLTVTTHNHGAVTTTVGSSAPCSQTPLSLSAASLSGRTS